MLLVEIKFDKYAQLKSKNNETFKSYPEFLDLLGEMKKLECESVCTEGVVKKTVKSENVSKKINTWDAGNVMILKIVNCSNISKKSTQ